MMLIEKIMLVLLALMGCVCLFEIGRALWFMLTLPFRMEFVLIEDAPESIGWL